MICLWAISHGGRGRGEGEKTASIKFHQCMWFTIAELLVLGTAWLAVNGESGLAGNSCGEGWCSRASLLQLWRGKTRKSCSDSPRYSVPRRRCQDVTTMHVTGRESESSVTNKNRDTVGPEYPQQVTERFNNFWVIQWHGYNCRESRRSLNSFKCCFLVDAHALEHKGSANSWLPCWNLLEWKWRLQGETGLLWGCADC